MSSQPLCSHDALHLEPSPFAELAGFERASVKGRLKASSIWGQLPSFTRGKIAVDVLRSQEAERLSSTFPAPLVLPHDALNYDPDEPAQSMKSWHGEKARNKLGKDGRKILYVADVPFIGKGMSELGMEAWAAPAVDNVEDLSSPVADDIIAYLSAFYHGMSVRPMPKSLAWVPWPSTTRTNPTKNGVPKYVALQHGAESTRIRVRAPPDGLFKAQLNLDDILDAAIRILPDDAYALLLLIDHDIYENDDDDFCCGRAYGGSRVAVVQSARYNPHLDSASGVDRAHSWPMSHCKAYVDALCAEEDVFPPPANQKHSDAGPLRSAITTASSLAPPTSGVHLESIWLSRVARTASHELGHCFGLAHCVYYACNMQSAGGMREDARQPPYLCPVCLSKVEWALWRELKAGEGGEEGRRAWEMERYEALRWFCEGKEVGMWKGLAAWIKSAMKNLGTG